MREEMNVKEGLLRGVEWRIKLGVLPADTRSIAQLRRAAANGRRKYAELRRRLLVDPHIMEESQTGADLNMDNPLSQNPESVWGRFFRNAELERTIDNDLSRLYPEHGSYFQTTSCQAILRRILLLRALRYPEHSYRQGMHELLAPLLYVLHVDIMHLSHVKHLYGDLFDDRFEDLSFQESNRRSKSFEERKNMSIFGKTVMKVEDEDKAMDSIFSLDSPSAESNLGKLGSNDDLDTDYMSIILSSDAYGAEGELGALLSTRFLEHDAYCMYDALLSGGGGAVAMADYFTNTPAVGSVAGLPPVIEASGDLYKLLAIADISLYSHLVDLGVEPQYFALRWLRVLFGREFELENLLHVWDAIFEASNTPLLSYGDDVHGSSIPYSPRSAFISAVAVSLLLHLRSSLLGATNATTCLQKLLNIPKKADVKKLIDKAKLLQALALDTNDSSPPPIGKIGRNFENGGISKLVRSTSASPTCQTPKLSYKAASLQHQNASSSSPDKLKVLVAESYWEQKWRNSMLQKTVPEDSFGQGNEFLGKALPGQIDIKNSTDASCQEHIVSNSVDSLESQEIGNENSSILSIADQELFSNIMGTKHESDTSSIRSARRKLLDGKFESLDLQVASNVNRLCLIEGNDTNTTDKNQCSGNHFDQRIEKHLVDSVDDKGTDIFKCSDSSKDFNSDTLSVQRSESQSKFRFDKEKNQETNALASYLDVRMTTELEVDKNSMHDKGRMNSASMPAKEEFSEGSISDGHIQTCPQHTSQVSTKCTSEEPSGKVFTSGSTQKGGNSDVTRKQNPPTAAHSGKLHWIWNFLRNTNVEKGSNGLNKTKGKDNIASDCKKVFPEKSSVSKENENDRSNSHNTSENKTKRDQPSQLCEDGRDQASHVCENHGDQSSHICEDIGDHHSQSFEEDRIEPLHISEDSRDQPLHISEDSDQPSHICENDREHMFCDHEIYGDELDCSSDASSSNVTNSNFSQPLINSEVIILSKNEDPSDNLRILGQSMLENIQVIESTFLQACVTKNKDEMNFASTERLEHSSMNSLAGKGQAAALVALTELRKISNVLSQM